MADMDEAGLVELHIQLLKLASLINRPMKEGVADPNGLSLDELKIVICLGGEGTIAGHEIRDLIAIPPMNVSRALESLLERHWIERVEDEVDRRRKPVRLTERGRAAEHRLVPDIASVARHLLGGLGAREQAALARTARRIIARMESWPPPQSPAATPPAPPPAPETAAARGRSAPSRRSR